MATLSIVGPLWVDRGLTRTAAIDPRLPPGNGDIDPDQPVTTAGIKLAFHPSPTSRCLDCPTESWRLWQSSVTSSTATQVFLTVLK